MFTVWILPLLVVAVVAKPPDHEGLVRLKRQQGFNNFQDTIQFGQNQRFPNNPFLNNQNNGDDQESNFNQGSNFNQENQWPNFNQGNQGSNQAFPNNPFLNQPVDVDDDNFSFLNPQTTSRTTTGRTNIRTSSTTVSTSNNGLPTTTPNAVPGAETPRTICEQQCLTTPQYNPVCGSDGSTYTNQAQLNCAVGCGKNVRLSHVGQCTARSAN